MNSKYETGKPSQILTTCTLKDMKREELREDDASSQNKWRGVMKHKLLTIDWIIADKADVFLLFNTAKFYGNINSSKLFESYLVQISNVPP